MGHFSGKKLLEKRASGVIHKSCNAKSWNLPAQVIQGQGTIRKSVCNFLFVNNFNLYHIWHRFPDIAEYWSNFAVDRGTPV